MESFIEFAAAAQGCTGESVSGQCRLAIAGMNRTPDTPYRLLWVPGTAAVLLCIAAFVLRSVGGAGVLFDVIVAFCT